MVNINMYGPISGNRTICYLFGDFIKWTRIHGWAQGSGWTRTSVEPACTSHVEDTADNAADPEL